MKKPPEFERTTRGAVETLSDGAIEIRRTKSAIAVLADSSAAGRLYRLTVELKYFEQEYRLARKEGERRIERQWIDLEPRLVKREWIVRVSLGDLPTIVVAAGAEVVYPLPRSIREIGVKKTTTKFARVHLRARNELAIAGEAAGRSVFPLVYHIGAEERKTSLVVSVVGEAFGYEGSGFEGEVHRFDPARLRALIGVRTGRFLAVTPVGESPPIASWSLEAETLTAEGLRGGTSRALVTLEGWKSSRRRGTRYWAQIPVRFSVTAR